MSGNSVTQIYAEQVRQLYRLSRAGYYGTLANAGIIAYALRGTASNITLGGWFAAVAVITLSRHLLYRAFVHADPQGIELEGWGRRFVLGAAAMGVLWGFLGAALYPSSSLPLQFLVIFLIGGMTVAAVVVLAPLPRAFYSFMLPAVVPLIAVVLAQGTQLHVLMSLMMMVFTGVMLGTGPMVSRMMRGSLHMKFEHGALVERLSQVNRILNEHIESQRRSEEALREASQKLEALIDASPIAILMRDAGGRVQKWNRAAERIFGWSEAEMAGRIVPFIPAGHEEEDRHYQQMILDGQPFAELEAVRLRKDGTAIIVSFSGAPVYDDQGAAIGYLTMIADITGRKRAELRQELQTAITRLLAESRTVEAALAKVIREMCGKLGWACGAHWVLDRQNNRLYCVEAWGADVTGVQDFIAMTRTMRLAPGKNAGVARRVWDEAAPVWVRDTLEDAGFQRGTAARASGLRSALGFPVLVSEMFYGVMEFFAFEVHAPDHELMEFTRQLGSQIGQFIARKQVEQRLQMEHAITRVLAEAQSVGEAIPAVLRTVGEASGWLYGARWELDRSSNLLRCAETWAVAVPEVEEFRLFNHMRTQAPERGTGLIHRVWNSNRPEWMSDVAQEPGMRRTAAALKAGLRSGFAFPITVGEKFYGVMEFFGSEVRPPDLDLMQIVHTIGSQIGQFLARKQAEDNLWFVATHDALTALPNRTMFGDRLSQALSQAQRYHRYLALLFIDLDGFKAVNDTLGHVCGDALLKEIAGRLRSCLREGDVIGRIGGDEFVVLIEEFGERAHLTEIARKLIEVVAQPVFVQGHECRVTASIGIGTYPQDGRDSPTLFKSADSAMYRAKELGKNRFQFHSA